MNRVRYVGRIYTEPIRGEFGSDYDLGIDPWVLGALLGDGCFRKTSIIFSNSEEYMIKKIKNKFSGNIKKVSECDKKRCDYRLTFNGKISSELKFLRDVGLDGKKSPDKFVPDVIFKSNRHIREQVLAGLLETDGWVEKHHAFLFSSSSERLRDNVVDLVRSLGGNASKTIKEDVFYKYKGKKKRGLRAFITCINLSNHEFLESPRILSRFKQKSMPYPKIIKVEHTGRHKSQCISVSHPSKLYCVNGYIMTHNTALALNLAKYAASHNRGNGAIVIFSLEMSKEQLATRLIGAEGKVDNTRIRNGNLRESDWDKMAMGVDIISPLNILINDKSSISTTENIRVFC